MNPYSLAGNAPAVDAELTVREFLHIAAGI
jgi:hypothetical protein